MIILQNMPHKNMGAKPPVDEVIVVLRQEINEWHNAKKYVIFLKIDCFISV